MAPTHVLQVAAESGAELFDIADEGVSIQVFGTSF
ncbi:hypothetical protein [Sphingomonas azotifigens]|nr:hypothetical protein [Sphingomonas azotifigens]